MKTLAIYGILIGVAAAAGTGAGTLVKRFGTEPERDYSGFDVSIYNIDEDALILDVESYDTKDMAFNFLTPIDIVNYAIAKYKRCENSYSVGYGLASTVVSQTVRNAQIKNGDTYFEESVSNSSMVHVAMRDIQTGIDGDVDVYLTDGTVVIDTGVSSYYSTPSHYECEEYVSLYGRQPSQMFNYILHKDTLNSSSKKSIDGGYELELVLNPEIATYSYQIQMKQLSNLSRLPVFLSSILKFTLDENLMLKHLVVNEDYKAVMGFEASISAHIEYKYFPDQYYKIPELTENFNYIGLINGGN